MWIPSIVGAIDPVQMTQQAPNQEVLYISGCVLVALDNYQ